MKGGDFFKAGKWVGKGWGPLISGKEIASEFGISTQSFAAMMRNDPDRPKYVNSTRTKKTRVLWYKTEEIRSWLAKKLGRIA